MNWCAWRYVIRKAWRDLFEFLQIFFFFLAVAAVVFALLFAWDTMFKMFPFPACLSTAVWIGGATMVAIQTAANDFRRLYKAAERACRDD